jgi:N-acetyl-gamma-glutamyl-phosphate reductase
VIRAGIVGATGLVGEGLTRILCRHPEVRLTVLTSRHAAGKEVAAELPGLRGMVSMELVEPSVDALRSTRSGPGCDVVFLAMKSAESMRFVPGLVSNGVRCIDIGGEFRFRDPAVYEQWYGNRHETPELCARAVWGLPEENREKITSADIVGNPGCYPTGAVLGLLPFLRKGLIQTDGIVVNAQSGVSGAGRQYSPKSENTFLACHENLRAYGVGTHKHTPEIEQALSEVAGEDVRVTFVPHLVPIDRGILTTICARPAEGAKPEALGDALKAFAGPEPFVRACATVEDVRTANVRATNFCDVGVALVERSSQVVIVTAIDNTVKGAGGQAVQNMNIMFELDEKAGLDRPGY